MKQYTGTLLFLICIALVLAAGCAGRTESARPPLVTETAAPVTTAATTAPVPATPAFIMTPGTTPPSVSVTVPVADPTDVQKITFLRYSDSDFSVDYPSSWQITSSTYFPDYCPGSFGPGKVGCYSGAVSSIGPFGFYDDTAGRTARIVIFTSADGRLKFASFTQDFPGNLAGNLRIDPNIDWTKSEFLKMYPGLFPTNYVGNYQYFRSGNAMAASYDARLPEGYYPPAYSKKVVVTVHHLYSFAFITNSGDADRYRDLNQRMMQSIETKDVA